MAVAEFRDNLEAARTILEELIRLFGLLSDDQQHMQFAGMDETSVEMFYLGLLHYDPKQVAFLLRELADAA